MLATNEARTLKHDYIGTEHILLGLLLEEEGIGARALESLDITAERVRAQVIQMVGVGEEEITGQIPFTPRAKKVLELALREALSLGHDYIGTEHVLLGLIRENSGVAAQVLLDFDAYSQKVRNEVIRMLCGPGHRRQAQSGEDKKFWIWLLDMAPQQVSAEDVRAAVTQFALKNDVTSGVVYAAESVTCFDVSIAVTPGADS